MSLPPRPITVNCQKDKDKKGQKGTKRDKKGQKGTKRDRDKKGQKGTKRDKKGQKETKRDKKGQKGTQILSLFVPFCPFLSLFVFVFLAIYGDRDKKGRVIPSFIALVLIDQFSQLRFNCVSSCFKVYTF